MTDLPIYDTQYETLPWLDLEREFADGRTYAMFTSASTVRGFVKERRGSQAVRGSGAVHRLHDGRCCGRGRDGDIYGGKTNPGSPGGTGEGGPPQRRERMAGDRDSLQMERTGSGLRRGWTTGTMRPGGGKGGGPDPSGRTGGCRADAGGCGPPARRPHADASGGVGAGAGFCCVGGTPGRAVRGAKRERDDPDVTDGVTVYAAVSFQQAGGITVDGGEGVGRVTKPGLDQPVGSAAINRVPREMICRELAELLDEAGCGRGLAVLVEIPGGESWRSGPSIRGSASRGGFLCWGRPASWSP